ncbi:Chain length determinant protein [compost metagenome]|uniref:Chain-length determining protein n=1 Tax=Pseudomonas wadenswilerensis TaxID=1785161 RepID=A0A380SXZ2_9PSED|nr:Wzz/FepE/Etk N-terminal domain-containing protein [Pseudomonas wadenswilerensis]SUQ62148.1 Chain-length determining protein [Pseudomonas wadenswilerensis]
MYRNASGSRPDDVDLFEVLRGLYAQKWLILFVTTIFIVIAAVYVFFAKPVYEVKLFVIPPTASGIANFNYGRTEGSGLEPYTVKDVYDVFLRSLQAESLRSDFFEAYYLPALAEGRRNKAREKLYDDFSDDVFVSQKSKQSPDLYVLTVRNTDPATAVAWARTYAEKAKDVATLELIKNVIDEAAVRARNLRQQINTVRESGQKTRENLIIQLKEALRVAEAVGLEKPPIIGGALSAELTASMSGQLVYMRGAQALRAEIHNLEQRKSDDPFLESLRGLQERYAFYKGLDVVPKDVSVYRVDGSIEQPSSPVKPRVSLLLALGLLVGFIVGVACALARYFYRKRLVIAG